MGEMVVVYAGEYPPGTWQASVFLAGPMPRDPDLPSWRPDMLDLLKKGWDRPATLTVFVPEARDRREPRPGYVSQLWEERWMAVVDVIAFWVPRDMITLPGLNTNIEFGRNENSGRIVLGIPSNAVSVHYLRRGAEQRGAPIADTIDGTVTAALTMIGDGAERIGPARDVPLLIWRTAAFQTWLHSTAAQLVSARVLWAWSPGPSYTLQAWAMQVETALDDAATQRLLLAQPGHRDVLDSILISR